MKSPLRFQARRELVERMAPQYRAASRTQKILLLDTFVALTSYVRTYAMWLLNHPVESRPRGPRGISTTQAGTLLKHHIPIRTFQDWNETSRAFWRLTWSPTVAYRQREVICTPSP